MAWIIYRYGGSTSGGEGSDVGGVGCSDGTGSETGRLATEDLRGVKGAVCSSHDRHEQDEAI